MTQQLGELADLGEDLGWIPSGHVEAPNCLKPQLQGSQYPLLNSTDTAYTQCNLRIHRHDTHIHKMKMNTIFLKMSGLQ